VCDYVARLWKIPMENHLEELKIIKLHMPRIHFVFDCI